VHNYTAAIVYGRLPAGKYEKECKGNQYSSVTFLLRRTALHCTQKSMLLLLLITTKSWTYYHDSHNHHDNTGAVQNFLLLKYTGRDSQRPAAGYYGDFASKCGASSKEMACACGCGPDCLWQLSCSAAEQCRAPNSNHFRCAVFQAS
jgi:hypothetical protein